ncbi:MAG: hypothetical protein JWQ98_3334 [Chlorobi bacterium]|nr:hypothetical protein [Chlorobiota bacterium]
MIGPDQDLSEFPRWIWPYIDVARLSKATIHVNEAEFRVPASAINAHVAAIHTAATIKALSGRVKDTAGKEFGGAASSMMSEEIDFVCGTPFPGWPRPHFGILEVAGQLAAIAASTADAALKSELGRVVETLAGRAKELAAGANIADGSRVVTHGVNQ